jgi:hypothetical protein
VSELEPIGRTLIVLGVVILGLGILIILAGKIPFLGKLPGDIVIRRDGFTCFFPLVTSIILSVILSLVLWLISRFLGR